MLLSFVFSLMHLEEVSNFIFYFDAPFTTYFAEVAHQMEIWCTPLEMVLCSAKIVCLMIDK